MQLLREPFLICERFWEDRYTFLLQCSATVARTFFGFVNVSGRIGTLFDFSAVQLLCEPFLDLRNVSGRIGTLFDFSAVQLLCEPFWICERFWEDRYSFLLQCSATVARTFFGFANVSGRIGTLFDFSAVQLLCEPFLDLRTFLGG